MSKYQEYSEYKISGDDLVGDIPVDWDLWKWKHMMSHPMMYGANEAALDDDRSNPRYIRITDMNSDGSLRDDTFRSLPLSVAEDYLLEDRDILVARTGATVGKSFLYKSEFGPSCFAGYLIRARINKCISNSRYVYWFLQSDQYWNYISGSQIQATIQNVSAEKYGDLKLPIPSNPQHALKIANFLDCETAKIDTLIEKQQQLIKLLKEKRQAVISHAVTKGLNPNAPMRDSGVEWLGDVPAHWGHSRIGFECSVKARLGWRGLKAEEYVDDGYIFLATPNIKDADIDFYNVNYITAERYFESPEIMLQVGDVLVTKDGSTTGTTNIVRSLPRPATVNSSIAVIRSFGRLFSSYLYYFFVSTYTQNVIKRMQDGMGVPHLFQADIRKFELLMPPYSEQKEIAEYIEAELPKLDRLISLVQEELKLLQERRTALISAAVTGKIDVRNWQTPADHSSNSSREPVQESLL